MIEDWTELTKKLSADIPELRVGSPGVVKTFSAMAISAGAQGALDPETKELIALAPFIRFDAVKQAREERRA